MSLYNRDLLNRALKALGKSLLIVTGVSYGVIKAMDVLAEEASDSIQSHSEESNKNNLANPAIERLHAVEQRLIRMEKSIEALAHEAPRPEPPKSEPVAPEPREPMEQFITRAELERTMQRFSDHIKADIGSDIDHRFEVQNRSVQSLRSMIARTDELLEQVIENIESTQLAT